MSVDPEPAAPSIATDAPFEDGAHAAERSAAELERLGMAWPPAPWERPAGVWRPDAWLAPPPDVYAPTDRPAPSSAPDAPDAAAPAAGTPASAPGTRERGARLVREALETMVMAGVMLVVLLTLVRNYKIEGTSMAPTLAPAEYILVSKLAYRCIGDPTRGDIMARRCLGNPARGDIIVFLDWNDRQDYIKRVIGLPGETVEVRDGSVWIDGRRLDEPYLHGTPTGGGDAPRTLGPDEYYVLGDNRGNSSDSRIHGPLKRSHIVGRAWLTYWPLDLFGRIGHRDDPAEPPG